MCDLLENISFCFYETLLPKLDGEPATPSKNITLKELSEYIATDEILKSKTEISNHLHQVYNGKGVYGQYKRTLPAFVASSRGSRRRIIDVVEHTSFMCADFDNFTDDEVEKVFELLQKDPHVALVYRSPSRKGIHALFYMRIPNSKDYRVLYNWQQKTGYPLLKSYCLKNFNKKIDWSAKDLVGAPFLVHDDKVHVNFNAIPLGPSDVITLHQPNNVLKVIKID